MDRSTKKIYFYEHSYLRDRQIATINEWDKNYALNQDFVKNKKGEQVSREKSTLKTSKLTWKQKLPLLNIKRRPRNAPKDSVIYVWGGLILSGEFIVDLDNPWSLVGYNLKAMSIYKKLIKRILESKRCIQINCLSKACRESLLQIFGDDIYKKAYVNYPTSGIRLINNISSSKNESIKLLFIGSQFEIKGGGALLDAYAKAKKNIKNLELTIITHLPKEFESKIKELNDIKLFSPVFNRAEIFELMRKNDILLHPSYMESFGMTILEAIANGMAIISNDIYAISEMVINNKNGILLKSPITKWDGFLPNKNFMQKKEFILQIRDLNQEKYSSLVSNAILNIGNDRELMLNMKKESIKIYKKIYEYNKNIRLNEF